MSVTDMSSVRDSRVRRVCGRGRESTRGRPGHITLEVLVYEIKQIAASYEKILGIPPPQGRHPSGSCKGEYRRLVVAWVDLSDQLGQAEKVITIPKEE